MKKTSNLNLIAPAYCSHPDAEAFADFLAARLPIDPAGDDLSGGYAWDTAIPPRSEWEREAEELARHLESL